MPRGGPAEALWRPTEGGAELSGATKRKLQTCSRKKRHFANRICCMTKMLIFHETCAKSRSPSSDLGPDWLGLAQVRKMPQT